MNTENQNIYWGISGQLWVIFGVLALLLAYPFMDTLIDMEYRWRGQEEYGYGYIIPLITAFLVWQRKDILAKMPMEPTLWAVPLLIFSGVIFFMGMVATTHTLSQYAFVLTINILAYGVLGRKQFMVVAIPMALLFLMVPLPPFILNNLSAKLQLISSELGVAVIRLFDISVFLEGNVIDLGKYQLQVVEACSGLNYLFPLMSLSFVAAYLYNVETWKRVLVFLSSIPITVLMNSFRIGVIGVLVEYYGIEQAEGFLHDFEGWIIFMACMGILFIEMAILARIGPAKKSLADVFALEYPEPPEEGVKINRQSAQTAHYVFIAVLCFYSISVIYHDDREKVQLERASFATFPDKISGWTGRKEKLEANILRSLKTDDYIISDYREGGDFVNFYIAYYADQTAGSAAHSPRACIPGGGWKINDLRTVTVDDVVMGDQELEVNRLLIRKGDVGQLVYYWFQQRGRVITNEYLVKWYLFLDALQLNRTDGSLIRLTTILAPGEDPANGDARLKKFISEVAPIIDEYVPR